jgi:hypothetical protein
MFGGTLKHFILELMLFVLGLERRVLDGRTCPRLMTAQTRWPVDWELANSVLSQVLMQNVRAIK